MTYRELRFKIDNLDDEQLDQDVTIYDKQTDEFFGVKETGRCHNGVLDDGHFYIVYDTVTETD